MKDFFKNKLTEKKLHKEGTALLIKTKGIIQEFFDLGMIKTYHKFNEVLNVAGFELAEMIEKTDEYQKRVKRYEVKEEDYKEFIESMEGKMDEIN